MARNRSEEGKDEDAALWDRVTRDVAPLCGGRQPRQAAPTDGETPLQQENTAAPGLPSRTMKAQQYAKSVHVERGRTPGLDRRTSDRLRRGQLPIDARLDLHGHNREQAHGALGAFIRESQAAAHRCLLVITGKGVRSAPDDFGRAKPCGVLKAAVPGWLAEPDLARRILATAPARPQHGGAGALYILLRRNR